MLSFYHLETRHRKFWKTNASECQRLLTEWEIVPGSPGTILKDLELLLKYVGPEGIVTSSRNGAFPLEVLPELNAKIGAPIRLDLRRPLLKDYPNLAGLFIVLRVMEMLNTKGKRIMVARPALTRWRKLNSTEAYFAVLEALLFHAGSSVLSGEDFYREEAGLQPVATFLGQLRESWHSFKAYESDSDLGPHGRMPPWSLFLQKQLGLIELRPQTPAQKESGHSSTRGWLVGSARLTAGGKPSRGPCSNCPIKGRRQRKTRPRRTLRNHPGASLDSGRSSHFFNPISRS